MNGTVAAISIHNGKLIDVETMSRFCKPCQPHRKMLSEEGFSVWYIKHKDVCAANYEGCSPMMVVEGTMRIFERSIESRKVRYLNCLKMVIRRLF